MSGARFSQLQPRSRRRQPISESRTPPFRPLFPRSRERIVGGSPRIMSERKKNRESPPRDHHLRARSPGQNGGARARARATPIRGTAVAVLKAATVSKITFSRRENRSATGIKPRGRGTNLFDPRRSAAACRRRRACPDSPGRPSSSPI